MHFGDLKGTTYYPPRWSLLVRSHHQVVHFQGMRIMCCGGTRPSAGCFPVEIGAHLPISEQDFAHPAKPKHLHSGASWPRWYSFQSDTHPTCLGLGHPLQQQLLAFLLLVLYSSPRCGHQPGGGDTGKEPVVRNNNKVPPVSSWTLLNYFGQALNTKPMHLGLMPTLQQPFTPAK